VVVINKIDRPDARAVDAINETFDLFIELGATDEQADFPVVYTVGLVGRAGYTPEDLSSGLTPLFETIIKNVPAPRIDPDAPARLLVTTLEYDNYKGQLGVGRLQSGVLRRGMPIVRITPQGERINGRIEYLFTFHNLAKQEVDEVQAGDIVAFGGLDVLGISDDCRPVDQPLPPISVEAPTVRMTFGVNTSPFAGREGKAGWGTSRKLRERLYKETRSNVALRVQDGESPDRFVVSGRGELHLGILIETMRREGYEFEVSKPQVIYHEDPETGELLEPIEEVYVDVADNLTGTVVEPGGRHGSLIDMRTESTTYMRFVLALPDRLRSQLLRATSGLGQIHMLFHGYQPALPSAPPGRQFGSLVAFEGGTATGYAMLHLQDRGTFFVDPGTEVYMGMVVGEHIRAVDLDINVAKAKHLTNYRAKPTDAPEGLNTSHKMSLDDYLEFLAEDELLEVTPLNLRLRKRVLYPDLRIKERKRREKQLERA
jgi:GTP-binding protein